MQTLGLQNPLAQRDSSESSLSGIQRSSVNSIATNSPATTPTSNPLSALTSQQRDRVSLAEDRVSIGGQVPDESGVFRNPVGVVRGTNSLASSDQSGDGSVTYTAESSLNNSDEEALGSPDEGATNALQGEEGDENSNAAGARGLDGELLTQAEQRQVIELKARDAEVRAHERAHKAVGGQYTGAISYTYQQGPDGRRYAVGGEVPIDVSPIPGDPQATINKLTVVKSAALAPAEPSSQDRSVAALASQGIAEARAELNTQRQEELFGDSEGEEQSTSNDSGQSNSSFAISSYIRVNTLAESSRNSLVDQLA